MEDQDVKPKQIAKWGFVVVFIVLFGCSFFSSMAQVKYGNTAVVTRMGKVTDRTLTPGMHFKLPFIEGVVKYNTQKITYETSDNPDQSDANYTDYPADTTTKDGQQVKVRYTVRFSVDPNKVQWVANNVGKEDEVVEKIVKTESRIHVRNTVREFNAEELYTGNIEQVQVEIQDRLTTIFEENGLILDSFGIRQVTFEQEYVDAIEAKQIAKEGVITQQNIAEQEKYKKEAAITKAEGEAEAQRLQQQTLNNFIIQKMWIEKWNGQLPTYTGNGDFLMSIPAK